MDKEIQDKLIKAGNIAGQALNYGASLVKPGVKVVDVCNEIENKIRELGGGLAFPPQVSLNDCAAHFCPDKDEVLEFSDQVISIDVGAHVDGYIGGDTALSIDLSNKHEDLIKASREALNAALKLVRPGVEIRELGKVIHETITSFGFSPVRNLSGHGLNRWVIHCKPSIPNYDNGDTSILKEDDLIAIEPFASNGAGVIYESSPATIFQLVNKRPVRNIITRQVLKEIVSFDNLPFCRRWLENKFGSAKTNFALRELKVQEMLREHPPLLDQNHGLVSQAEHTIIVKDKPIILTKV